MPFVNSMRGVHGVQSGVTSTGLILDLITGGTITTSGDYRIHTFTTSGTFETYTRLPIEYLVVGGGGNGYIHPTYSGGGGGGGAVIQANANIAAGQATIVIGGPATASSIDSNPQTPVALNVVANAGTPAPPPGRDNRAGGTSGNGNIGNDYSNSGYTGGGGGGAGQAVGPSTTNRNGGQGVESNITGTNVWYGGGGASGAVNRPPYNSGPKHAPSPQPGWNYGYGVGGVGGGGNAPDNPGVYPGKVNTGGGAAGSSAFGYNTQHTGGPGIVVIRYKYK
jgi:hypothetical protein